MSVAFPVENSPRRKRALRMLGLSLVFVAITAGCGVYYWLVARFYETTDNAYVATNVVQITPQITATVVAINVEDTDYVHAGQVLVELDPADARVALDQAEAELARTVREVRTLYANNASLSADIAMHEAENERARTNLVKSQGDLATRQALVSTGAVGKEELKHAEAELGAAKAALAAAKAGAAAAAERLTSNQALTDGVAVADHPRVLQAAARVREAYLALQRTKILAPVAGYVAKRGVQVGQRVQPGAPLMSVVPLDEAWVDANFKEGQLRRMRIGQPVTLTADLYGDKVEYRGTVEGLGAGTGAAFSILPAQNASGNWIKIVQRLPVRIAMDPAELKVHPLRVGLSMEVKVDLHHEEGKALTDAPRGTSVSRTTVFDDLQQAAQLRVKDIIAANLGRPLSVATHATATPTRPAPASVAAIR